MRLKTPYWWSREEPVNGPREYEMPGYGFAFVTYDLCCYGGHVGTSLALTV